VVVVVVLSHKVLHEFRRRIRYLVGLHRFVLQTGSIREELPDANGLASGWQGGQILTERLALRAVAALALRVTASG